MWMGGWVAGWLGGCACFRKGEPTCRSGQHSESGWRGQEAGKRVHMQTRYRRGCREVDKQKRTQTLTHTHAQDGKRGAKKG